MNAKLDRDPRMIKIGKRYLKEKKKKWNKSCEGL